MFHSEACCNDLTVVFLGLLVTQYDKYLTYPSGAFFQIVSDQKSHGNDEVVCR